MAESVGPQDTALVQSLCLALKDQRADLLITIALQAADRAPAFSGADSLTAYMLRVGLLRFRSASRKDVDRLLSALPGAEARFRTSCEQALAAFAAYETAVLSAFGVYGTVDELDAALRQAEAAAAVAADAERADVLSAFTRPPGLPGIE